jgi:Pyruvate/2-oxoacid:ferredoxin oxidoreductase delta subunit
LDHCKGCSICSSVCPVKCITMIKESDALKKDLKE